VIHQHHVPVPVPGAIPPLHDQDSLALDLEPLAIEDVGERLRDARQQCVV
jgi:hypothetical protein